MNTPIETCYMLTAPSQALKAHDAWMEDVSQSLQEVYPAGLGLLEFLPSAIKLMKVY